MKIKGFSNTASVVCIIVMLSFLLGGCTTLRQAQKSSAKLLRRLVPFKSSAMTHPGLIKTIAFTRFTNKTRYTELNFDTAFQNTLLKTLEASCPATRLVLLGDPGFPAFLLNPPLNSTGEIDGFVLAQKVKPTGFNAVLNVSLLGVLNKFERKGLRIFRGMLPWISESQTLLEVQVAAEMFDTETGAKLMDEVFLHTVEADQIDQKDALNAKIENLQGAKMVLDKIAAAMSEKICDTINSLPWVGYVLRTDVDRLRIAGGRKNGLQPGQLFEIFDTGRVMQGTNGQRFQLRGEKAGEIRIEIVHENDAEAVIVSGQRIRPGYSIIPK